jgi:hypothetical protein
MTLGAPPGFPMTVQGHVPGAHPDTRVVCTGLASGAIMVVANCTHTIAVEEVEPGPNGGVELDRLKEAVRNAILGVQP